VIALDRCPCGRPWRHYRDPDIGEGVAALIRRLGPVQRVTVGAAGEWRTWLVARDYIALHGLRGDALPDLGFPELGQPGYLLFPELPAITCATCGRTSWHPGDVEHRYCGACHHFHGQP
jgi:hypothetical protein